MKKHAIGTMAAVAVVLLLATSSSAQRVESCIFNKDGFYNSAWYGTAKDADWQTKFSSSVDYNSFSVCFYKCYTYSAPTGSASANAAAGVIASSPEGRLGLIGYVIYYWKDGYTEQNAIASKWRKVVGPNLECAEFGICCSNETPRRCGAAYAIENGFDWRQNPLQCITLGDLDENKRYNFKVYMWTCPSTTIATFPGGYYNAANFPPKYDSLRNRQAVPYIQWAVWIAKGSFVTGSKPAVRGGSGGARYR